MRIGLQLPKVKPNKNTRPPKCPYCKGETFQRWGQMKKQVKDPRVRTVRVYRYKCTSCRRTFRDYPAGVARALQSERMKVLAVFCWSFGLSYRKLEAILSAFGVSLSRMSGWLNGQGVMVAVDMGDGQPLESGAIDEKEVAAVTAWLRDLKQRHAIGVIVTDDLATYRGITERLELGHQVCHFHVRRWVGRACWD